MGNGLKSQAWRVVTCAIVLALSLGLLPGLLSSTPVAAQADELTQREFRTLVEDAQEADDPVFGPEDGELEHDPDRVSLTPSGVDVSDFLVSVTFQNPYAGSRQQFDYGIQFRSQNESGDARFLRFIVISDGTWGLTDGVEDIVDTGQYDDLDDSRRGENELIVYADGDVVHLGINGDYVTSLEVSLDDPGDIAVGTSFLSDSFEEGAVTEFTDFAIWELEGRSSDTRRTPEDEETPEVEGTEYESATYGYTLTYDDSWDVETDTSRRRVDTLELDNGTSSLQIIGSESDQTPTECVDDLIDNLESDDTLTDVTVALDEDDNELRGDSDEEAFVVLQVTVETEAGPSELTMFYTCIAIVEGESMLEITHLATSEDYNDEVENRAAVLDTLSIDGRTSDSGRRTPEPDDEEPTAEATESELPEGSVTVLLETTESDGPLVFGSLVPDGDQTEVSLIILPADPGVEYAVTINSGTCRRPGATEFEIGTPSPEGYLSEVVDAAVEDLSNGDFILLVTEGGDPDATIACGVIEPLPEDGLG
jgi:hypothetical protein